MQRVAEQEVMDDWENVEAYANADFSVAHNEVISRYQNTFQHLLNPAKVLDLGCGAADIAIRFSQTSPRSQIDAVDASAPMLAYAEQAVRIAGLSQKIKLYESMLPDCHWPTQIYDLIISNSLLHHMTHAEDFWQVIKTIAHAQTHIFVVDLCRPDSLEQAAALTQQHMADAPEILQQDFYNSLLAAYTLDEVKAQLDAFNWTHFHVEKYSDRHMMIAGRICP